MITSKNGYTNIHLITIAVVIGIFSSARISVYAQVLPVTIPTPVISTPPVPVVTPLVAQQVVTPAVTQTAAVVNAVNTAVTPPPATAVPGVSVQTQTPVSQSSSSVTPAATNPTASAATPAPTSVLPASIPVSTPTPVAQSVSTPVDTHDDSVYESITPVETPKKSTAPDTMAGWINRHFFPGAAYDPIGFSAGTTAALSVAGLLLIVMGALTNFGYITTATAAIKKFATPFFQGVTSLKYYVKK